MIKITKKQLSIILASLFLSACNDNAVKGNISQKLMEKALISTNDAILRTDIVQGTSYLTSKNGEIYKLNVTGRINQWSNITDGIIAKGMHPQISNINGVVYITSGGTISNTENYPTITHRVEGNKLILIEQELPNKALKNNYAYNKL